jgi:hypothetical protein
MYYHIIKKRQPRYFGFIDHDLFPIKAISLSQKLESHPVDGHLVQEKNYWYLWAGLCFYQFDFVKNKKMDFLPTKVQNIYLDTGGGNWHTIYSKMDVNKVLVGAQQLEYQEEMGGGVIDLTLSCWTIVGCIQLTDLIGRKYPGKNWKKKR